MNETLFKVNNRGQLQSWTIEVEGDKFRTTEGLVGGAQTTSKWTVAKAKNVGRANSTSPEEQAILEAAAKFQKQIDKGYRTTAEDARSVDEFSPMLAHKWDDHGAKCEFPVASQPKLDGIRCVAKKDGLKTRNGKPITSCPHIEEALRPIFEQYPDAIFDGELYNHDLKEDFNKIISLVRKTKSTEADIEEARKVVQYHIYDFLPLGSKSCRFSFDTRHEMLQQLFFRSSNLRIADSLRHVDTVFLDNQERIDKVYGEYLNEGYEGQMIRVINSPYEQKRSKGLLKRKEFVDIECAILDIEEGAGNRSGMMGRVQLELPNGTKFAASARGSHDYFAELLANKDNYIGKFATVRYQNLTPDGVPRFPVMIAVRDYE